MTQRAQLSSHVNLPRARRSETGFSLTEMVIVVAIFIILAAIAIPVFLVQQQAAAKNSVITDVTATQTKIAQSLFPNPTADPILGYYPENKATTNIPAGGVGVVIIRTDSRNTIVVTNAVNDGTAATTATGTGSWRGYEITGTNSRVPNWYYTYNSNTGKYTTNTTNNSSTNPQPTRIPSFTTTSLPTGSTGNAYSANVVVRAQPAASFTASGLPIGLSINATTGTIAGTPGADGVYTVVVTATNSVGTTTKTYSLIIQSIPQVTSTFLPLGTVGNAYNTTVTASGYPTPTFIATGLPSGLSINANTGAITGTIASTVAGGTYVVTIKVTNVAGSSSTNLAMAVAAAPAITTTSLPNAVKGSSYSTTLQATGYPSPTFTMVGTTTGLTLDANTGVLSGTPTVSGQYNLTFTATNPGGTANKTLILTINSAATITTSTLATATLNSAYSQQVNANGYPAPTFSATGLPAGLTMNSTGLISGTPTAGGSFTVTVTAANTYNSTAYNDTKAFALNVTSASAINTNTLPDAFTNNAYSQTIQTSGYPAPTFSASTANWVQCATEGSTCTLPDSTTRQVRFGTSGSYNYITTNSNTACNVGAFGDPAPTVTKICYYLGTATAGMPTGLTLNSATGDITGTTTTGAGYNLTITANNGINAAQKSYNINSLTKLAAPTGVGAGRIFGNQATANWNTVSNANLYTVTYTNGGSGTRTVTTNSIQDNQTITASPNTVGVSVIARGTGYYADSPAATGNIVMPGYRMNAGTDFSACPRQDVTTGVTAACAITSSNGAWSAVMQLDGNFVTYRNNLSDGSVQPFYATSSQNANVRMSVQGDGNLVLYGANTGTKASNTSGNGNVRLDMQTDGNLVLYRQSDGAALWGTFNVGGGNLTNFMYFVQGWNASAGDYDPSAENNAAPGTWHTYFQPDATWTTDDKYSGSKSYRINTQARGNWPEGIIAGPDSMPIGSGQNVLINMWVKGTPGESWAVGGRQGNPYNEGMSGYTLVTNGQWQRISVFYTAPSGGFTGPYIQLRQNNIGAGKYLYADDVIIWRGWNQ